MEKIQKFLKNNRDKKIFDNYMNFVGKEEVLRIMSKYDKKIFSGRWEQVLTSLSTNMLGSGVFYSSVNSSYTMMKDGSVRVLNRAINSLFQEVELEGISNARNELVPICRSVLFENCYFEGNYWIIYIADDKNTLVICAPLFLFGTIDISNNFGLYVLTRNRQKFWNSEEPQRVFEILGKYGFNRFWNSPIDSGLSFFI